jgi:hypothetical protein
MLPRRSSVACPRPFQFGNGVPDGDDRVRPDTTGHAVSGSLSDHDVYTSTWTPDTGPRGHRMGTRVPDVRP